MGIKITKPQLIIGGTAIVTIGGIIYKKKQNEQKSNSSISCQKKQNQEQTKQSVMISNPQQVGFVQNQSDIASNDQQDSNNRQINNEDNSFSLDSVYFINRVNQELKAYQEQDIPLSFEVLMQIAEAGFKLVAEPYSQNQQRNRIERRKVINNPQQYTNCILEFNNELEVQINEKQFDVCNKLKISSQIYENSFILQFQNQAAIEKLIILQLSQRQQLIASIPSQKDISESELAQVTDIQSKKLDDVQFLQKYLKTLQGDDQQFGSVVITVLLSDIVYNQLGFEEEDILKAALSYPKLKKQLSQIQQKLQIVLETYFQ